MGNSLSRTTITTFEAATIILDHFAYIHRPKLFSKISNIISPENYFEVETHHYSSCCKLNRYHPKAF